MRYKFAIFELFRICVVILPTVLHDCQCKGGPTGQIPPFLPMVSGCHHVAWIKNRVFTCSLNSNITPYQAYFGKKPSLATLQLFGCKAYTHPPKIDQSKFGECTIKCIHIGFAEEKRHTYYTVMSTEKFSSHTMSSLRRLRVRNESLLTQTAMTRGLSILPIPEMAIQKGDTQSMPLAHLLRRWITRRSKRSLPVPLHILVAHNPCVVLPI